MGEELKPAGVYRPRRLRPIAREDREENDERFHKELAELTDDDRREDSARRPKGRPKRKPPESSRSSELPDQTEPGVGRNLDLRT